MRPTQQNQQVYKGDRGAPFKNLITKVLKLGHVKDEYINVLTNDTNIAEYSKAFTSSVADPSNNYEFYEILGDSTINNAIVYTIFRKLPQLHCSEGVKVIARLKINIVSKETFFNIARDLGFFNFITATVTERATKMKSLLEDCFEAFFGVTVILLDKLILQGVGYAIAYDIIETLLNEPSRSMLFSLVYTDLYDPKTRLKETFDYFQIHEPVKITKIKYTCKTLEQNTSNRKVECVVNTPPMFKTITSYVLGRGSAAIKANAEQNAAAAALDLLASHGYVKPISPYYTTLCQTYPALCPPAQT
jgi:dsRNA-specific ribonuclease